MALPKIDWDLWKQPSIAPVMKAVVHFPLGDITWYDDDITNVSFTGFAFDSSYFLFGPPTPATGSIEITDYEQFYNPTYNSELTSGIEIELFLGLNRGYGTNLVNTVEDQVLVSDDGIPKYVIPFTTSEPLQNGARYRLAFTFILPDGTEEVVEVEDIFEELFIVPDEWPDSTRFGLVSYEEVTIFNLSVQSVLVDYEPYGIFYSQDWSYTSEGSIATVNITDSMSDVLLLDNRRDALKPAGNVNAQNFLVHLLSLYTAIEEQSSCSYVLPYTFYEDSQATTVGNLVTAIGKNLFFLPDGSFVLSDCTGFYDTGIVLTDEDVDAYDIQQTSSVFADSVCVIAQLPKKLVGTEVATFSELTVLDGETLPYNASRILKVDYVAVESISTEGLTYSYDVVDFVVNPYGNKGSTFFDSLSVYGDALEFSEKPVFNVSGTLPYEISDNRYIQTITQANILVQLLEDFIDFSFRVISVTIRGCYGLWVGAKLRIESELYAVKANYVIIALAFNYDGAVNTTLTLQRID